MPSSRGRRRCRGAAARPSAWAGLCGLLVYLVGAMGGYLHFAFVQHERCPEHGELIHAQERAEARDHAAAVPVSGQAPAHVSSVGSGDDDSHDPCFAVASLSPRCCVSSSDASVARAESGDDRGSHDLVALAVAILDLAPKTSPPAPRA